MTLKSNHIPPAQQPATQETGHTSSQGCYQRCPQCDILFSLPAMQSRQCARCPRCNGKIRDAHDWSLARLTVMALTMLLLMPLAWSEPLLRIYLLGVHIDASLYMGIWQMARQGDPLTASIVLFCTIGAPLALVAAIIWLWIGNILTMNLRPVLLMLEKIKEWVMLDVYLIGITVAAIKVKDYAFLQPGFGLYAFVALVIVTILTLIHLNVEQLWQRFYPRHPAKRPDDSLRVCPDCHFTGLPDDQGRCPRCHTPLHQRRPQSIQKCWATLLTSLILLLPANLLPISIIYVNGARQEDTLISGIISLADSNIAVAAVVFIASILAPFTKIIVLFTLLLSIHFNYQQGLRSRMFLLRFVRWIGRWSMLDLFVISLMMSLINRDQLLAFTPGPAAFYFGAAVILTILAVEWLDSRLLWDAHESGNPHFDD